MVGHNSLLFKSMPSGIALPGRIYTTQQKSDVYGNTYGIEYVFYVF